jgi:hypothetical protein
MPQLLESTQSTQAICCTAHSPLLPKCIDALEHRDHCCMDRLALPVLGLNLLAKLLRGFDTRVLAQRCLPFRVIILFHVITSR